MVMMNCVRAPFPAVTSARSFSASGADIIWFRPLLIRTITMAEAIAVSTSATGMKYRMPFSPIKIGSSSGRPTPKTISRIRERAVDCFALPRDCTKMKVPLFRQDSGSRQRKIRIVLIAKSV